MVELTGSLLFFKVGQLQLLTFQSLSVYVVFLLQK